MHIKVSLRSLEHLNQRHLIRFPHRPPPILRNRPTSHDVGAKCHLPWQPVRYFSIRRGDILHRIKDYTRQHPVAIFRSTSNNPYHNLAIENYLLKQSDVNSRILLTYTNRPCVVIGRNQNPWLECNIARLQQGLPWRTTEGEEYETIYHSQREALSWKNERDGIPLDLVRRRSGGGTVVHDAGNLNFSFIVPNDKDFTRNKHAQLVVDVLREYKRAGRYMSEAALYENVRVNDRHDIVMTRAVGGGEVDKGKEFKVSGSAFKLTRGRALHHGTILHSSPNLNQPSSMDGLGQSLFSVLLSSPAAPYLEAKGVGSVRSAVHNLFNVGKASLRSSLAETLQDTIAEQFRSVYNAPEARSFSVGNHECQQHVNEEINRDVRELMTDTWRYCQTPTFGYTSPDFGGLKIAFEVKQGIIKRPRLVGGDIDSAGSERLSCLEGLKLHEIQNWNDYVPQQVCSISKDVVAHLSTTFPRIHLAKAEDEGSTSQNIVEEKFDTGTPTGQSVVTRTSPAGKVEVERKGQNVITDH